MVLKTDIDFFLYSGSPFIQEIDELISPKATGEGLKRGAVDQPAKFNIDARGFPGDLHVDIKGVFLFAMQMVVRSCCYLYFLYIQNRMIWGYVFRFSSFFVENWWTETLYLARILRSCFRCIKLNVLFALAPCMIFMTKYTFVAFSTRLSLGKSLTFFPFFVKKTSNMWLQNQW